MFKLAVLGPILAGGLGAARQCISCRRSQPRGAPAHCPGFEAGCLGYRPAAMAAHPSDYGVRLGLERLRNRE